MRYSDWPVGSTTRPSSHRGSTNKMQFERVTWIVTKLQRRGVREPWLITSPSTRQNQTDDAGALDRRLTSLDDLRARGVSAHLYRLVETAWNLGVLPHLTRLRAWAHSLGFGGHWLTKSRRYSVTFSFLRSQRQAWQVQRRQGTANASAPAIALGVWKWVGTGWRTAGDEWLAARGQTARVHSRLEARDARRSEAETFTDIEYQWTSEFSRTSMTSRATTSLITRMSEMSSDRREGSDEGE